MEKVMNGVARTSLITVVARARESRSAAPRLRDPWAERIVDRLELTSKNFSVPRPTVEGTIQRTLWFDERVRAFMRAHRGATVVNLGAGLDARFLRLDDGEVRWFDVDLPQSVVVRRQFYDEGERNPTVAADMFEPDLLDRLGLAGPTLFVMEGLVMYLPVIRLADFFVRAATRCSGGQVLFDAVTPFFARKGSSVVREIKRSRAPMEWGVWEADELSGLFPALQVMEWAKYDSRDIRRCGLVPGLLSHIPWFSRRMNGLRVMAALRGPADR